MDPRQNNENDQTVSTTITVTSDTSMHHSRSEEVEEWKAGRQEITILLTLSTISLVVAMDSTILVPALPTLAKELNGTAIETFWAGTSFLLSNATFLPFIGALSDIFGRRELLLVSVGLFTLGTIICCVSNDFSQLLAGRTVQGIGGGGIIIMALIVLTDIVPLRQRPKYQSFLLLAAGLGSILGPLVGGLIAQHTTWRWLFYINFPFCGIGLISVPLTVKLKTKQSSLLEKLLRIDWIGGMLFIAGVSSLLIGLTWGGLQYPWSSWQSWVPILLGGIGIFLTILYENLVANQPFLRLSVFSNTSARIIFFCACNHGLLMYAQLYYLPFYLSSVKGLNSTLTGVCLLADNILCFPLAIVVGIFMSRKGRFLWAIWTGWTTIILGSGILLVLNQGVSVAVSFFIILVNHIGQSFLVSSLNVAIQSIVRSQNVAYAVSMYTFMRTFGMCLGVAIGGTVFQNVLLHQLKNRKLPEDVALDSEAFVAELTAMPDGPTKTAFRAAYSESFHGVFYTFLALATLSGILSLFVKHHNMDKKLDSEHVLDRNKGKIVAIKA